MARTFCVIVSGLDRQRLETIASDRNRPWKHAERARVVLASADGGPVPRVAALLGGFAHPPPEGSNRRIE